LQVGHTFVTAETGHLHSNLHVPQYNKKRDTNVHNTRYCDACPCRCGTESGQ